MWSGQTYLSQIMKKKLDLNKAFPNEKKIDVLDSIRR